jgi:hypothetical protein
VLTVSLNLPAQGAAISLAQPAAYTAPATAAAKDLPTIVMPAAMEAAAK